ncbi:MAG: hypothetical protein H0T64_12305 [Pyrinomonadaceae bacterium]|nr:hypothetical protein [Pyrinomonadaceae bacterium]
MSAHNIVRLSPSFRSIIEPVAVYVVVSRLARRRWFYYDPHPNPPREVDRASMKYESY